jgi:small subunit ribosomal protein S6
MTFIIRPDRDEDGTRAVAESVTGRISAAGGEIVAAIPWNPPRRRMAYPIKDFGDGFYVTTVFRIEPSALGPIETALKLNDNILRFLIVQATDLNIKQALQRVQQQQAAAAAPPPQQPAAPAPEGAAPATPANTEATVEATPEAPAEGETQPIIATEEVDAAAAAPQPVESTAERVDAETVPEPVTAGTPAESQE